jgi:hypothetical protein
MKATAENKKAYTTPRFMVYGTIEEITRTKCLSWSQDDYAGETFHIGKFSFTIPENTPGGCSIGS